MRFLISLTLVITALSLNARRITPDEAMSAASDLLNSASPQLIVNDKGMAKAPANGKDALESPYYIFNKGNNGGFVIISGDDRIQKVLGYSDKGNFDTANVPPQLSFLLDKYAENLQKMTESTPVHSSWRSKSSAKEVVYLNTAEWNQFAPYNLKAPVFDGERGPMGCVATALAIIMKYHEFPKKAIKDVEHKWYCGTDSYTYDFGNMNIDYSLLRDKYLPEEALSPAEEESISELVYACAAALNMQFGPWASSATEQDKPRIYREIFGFDEKCQYIARTYFNDDQWNMLIQDQLNNNMPVLYSARAPYEGHAFVLDGYDSEGNYHVNWGWGGYENGYFSLDGLLDFDRHHGMTINMRPSDSPEEYSKKYSRLWVDGGTVNDANGMGKSAGMNVNVSDIKKGNPFDLKIGCIFYPFDFAGTGTIALLDGDGKIIELADGFDAFRNFEIYVDEGWQAYGRDWNIYGILNFNQISFNCDINENYRIAFVTKEEGDEEWKIVPSTLDAPASLPVTGNTPALVNVNVNYHGREDKLNLVNTKDSYMIGDAYNLELFVEDGVATIYVDDVLTYHATSYHPLSRWIELVKDSYDIDIYYKTRDELVSRSYDVETPGTLQYMIDEEDRERIGSINVSGKINTSDIEAAGDLPYLLNIDLENAEFIGDEENRENYFPKFALYVYERSFCPPFESIMLPKNLKGFEQISLNSYSMEALDIPASVDDYDYGCLNSSPYGTTLNFVNVRNPIPGKLSEGHIPFTHTPNELTLFVPEGSKQAYENNDMWRNQFKEIIEVTKEDPYIGEYVEDDNARYLILTDFAAIIGFKGKKEVDKIAESVEFNGKTYPVKYAVTMKLNAPQKLVAPLSDDFNWNHTNVNDLYCSSLMQTYQNVWVKGTYNVPGASLPYYDYNSQEMYRYNINQAKGLLAISSESEDVRIESIYINGEKVEPKARDIYVFEASSVPHVKVEYTLFGEFSLSTEYDENFNSTLPDSDIEWTEKILAESLTITPDVWTGEEGNTFSIAAVILPENATDKTLLWESSDVNVATVDNEGNVSVIKEGTCVITVSTTDGSDLKAECTITSLAGIDRIFAEPDARADVYNLNGVMVKRDCSREDLRQLTPAIYIVRKAGKDATVLIKN